jgi:uncharacterized Tic20 family protein
VTGVANAGWYPDPFQRHEHRYFNGNVWTDQVSDGGSLSTAPPLQQQWAPTSPAWSAPGQQLARPAYPVATPGQYVPGADERSAAMWCHLGVLLVGVLTCGVLTLLAWIIPLAIMNGKGRESAFVRHHASQALNFFIEMLIAGAVAFVLVFVLIGFILLPALIIWNLVFLIVASVKASSGEWYFIPANLPLIR